MSNTENRNDNEHKIDSLDILETILKSLREQVLPNADSMIRSLDRIYYRLNRLRTVDKHVLDISLAEINQLKGAIVITIKDPIRHQCRSIEKINENKD